MSPSPSSSSIFFSTKTSLQLLLLLFAVFCLSSSYVFVFAEVRCRTGEFAHSCPSEMPVCCFDSLGYSTGCCQIFTLCSSDGNCDPGPGVPNNTIATEMVSIDSFVHLSWKNLALCIGLAVGLLIMMTGSVFASGQFKSYMARRRIELRAQQLREAGLFGQENADGTDSEVGVNTGYEADVWDVTSDDEKEYRLTVLSSEEATIKHVLDVTNGAAGVVGRMSAWFGGGNGNAKDNKPSSTISAPLSPREGKTDGGAVLSTRSSARLTGLDDNNGHSINHSYGTLSNHNVNNNNSNITAEHEGENNSSKKNLPTVDPTERYLLANCNLCKIRLANCTLLPCTHSDICEDCAKHMKRCPECKLAIKKRVKIFMG